MVTHNPELASKYATRTVRLLDGKIVGDDNPCSESETSAPVTVKVKEHTSMSFATAMSLSLHNLMTKKARTLLTAFAGSIGIIGIALILSLSHGFQSYIDTVQEQTLSSYPLTIEANPVDMSGMLTAMTGAKDDSKQTHDLDKVYANTVMYSMLNSMVSSATVSRTIAGIQGIPRRPRQQDPRLHQRHPVHV